MTLKNNIDINMVQKNYKCSAFGFIIFSFHRTCDLSVRVLVHLNLKLRKEKRFRAFLKEGLFQWD